MLCGWCIVGVAFLAHSVKTGSVSCSSGVFPGSLAADSGWTGGRVAGPRGDCGRRRARQARLRDALVDRPGHRDVIPGSFALQAAGVACLLLPPTPAPLTLCVLACGVPPGGNATLRATVIGERFGRTDHGTIAARMSPFIVVPEAPGTPLTGAVRDLYGSYVPALRAIPAAPPAAVLCVAAPDLPGGPLTARAGVRAATV